ncbi:GIY-YIG nuclease family protein [Pseudidiomarina woesei]|uniref:GIY-YIG catalytic domain n=1 Tax=Pseudidiomarina woesei TaxID=1381080 RepID=A0A0K6HA62_9GAMM|nr:GIY-YIG nuclease family protein [Pseudidiomarina woesei]CUA87864.1 GIY-YIG catalytic domain [Pseudidiomarina woesei]
MPTKPRQTIVYINSTKVVLSDYYEKAKIKEVPYQVFRDRVRSKRDQHVALDYQRLERAIRTPIGDYQKFSGSGRAISFTYDECLFPDQIGKTFPSIKSFMCEVGLEHHYPKVKAKRKTADLSLDELIEAVQNSSLAHQEKKGLLYRITHIESGMKYYGLTRQRLRRRWNQHCNLARKGSSLPLHYAIRENGAASFSVEVVKEDIPIKRLANLERQYIRREQTQWPNGLNACSGGQIGNLISEPVEFDGQTFSSQVEFGNYVENLTNGGVKSYVAISRLRAGQQILCKQRHHSPKPYAGKPLYRIWKAKFNKGLLCSRWQSFNRFSADIGAPDDYSSPYPDKLFCRIDNKTPFGPRNYRWITRAEKAAELSARTIEYNGKKFSSFVNLAKATGIAASTLIYWSNKYPLSYETNIRERIQSAAIQNQK